MVEASPFYAIGFSFLGVMLTRKKQEATTLSLSGPLELKVSKGDHLVFLGPI